MAIKVPVVAHRLFGTKFLPITLGTARSHPVEYIVERIIERNTAAQIPVLDTDHGTRRSKESIVAFFSDEPSLPHTTGWSVNTLWARSDIVFELVRIKDHRIDSGQADLMPDRRTQPDWSQFNRKGSLNVYFCLEIEGARGEARQDSHPHPNRLSSGRILMGDRWHLDEGRLSRKESWRGDVITLAHEFGHALTLPHQGNPTSIMVSGTTRDSVELNRVEGLVAWQHAWKYSWASALSEGIVGRAAGPILRTAIGRSVFGRLGSHDRSHV